MNQFLQAVIDSDVIAAKQAFASEMSTRTAAAIEDVRVDITTTIMSGGEDE